MKMILAIGLLFATHTGLASDCAMRNCSNPSDCIAASNEQSSCRRAAERVKQLETERKEAAERAKHKAEIDAVKKIEEANTKVRTTGTPQSVDPKNR